MMKTSIDGRNKIAAHEGLRLDAYPDPGTGGEPWTIGVGHTGGVKPGQRITREEAMVFLADDLKIAESAVNGYVTTPLSQNQFDALVSLVFNIGAKAFRDSTLLRMLNAGRIEDAAMQFLRWDKAGGRVMAGLARRRDDERRLFLL